MLFKQHRLDHDPRRDPALSPAVPAHLSNIGLRGLLGFALSRVRLTTNPILFRGRFVVALLIVACSGVGCGASVPPSRYGVEDVAFEGIDKVDEEDVRQAIATAERDSFLFLVWPWTEWPLFDNTVFERDVARIERWYRARGYYHAKVTGAEVEPRAALQSDRIPSASELEPGQEEPCERVGSDEGCVVRVKFAVEEGEAVLVNKVSFTGSDVLPQSVREDLEDALLLRAGDRFDESLYDESKREVKRALGTASYARAQVNGVVKINPATNQADIDFKVTPGPTCTLGKITVAGNEELPADIILSASYLETGDAYDTTALEEANRAVAALGAFSAVSVQPQIPPEDNPSSVIDVVIQVTPGRLFHLGIGVGFQLGTMEFGDQQNTNSVWDVHLLFFLEDRNLWGGFRKFRVEERPRLIFPESFPGGLNTPKPGNEFKLEFRQPDFVEARTTLVATGDWDYGPDPNVPIGERFYRHEIGGRVGPERSFFDGRLFTQLAVRATVFLPDEGSNSPSSYHSIFLEERLGLDFRDNPTQPSLGVYLGSTFQQAPTLAVSSWTFNRAVPEIRGYVPLADDLVLAGRFSLGWMDVSSNDDELPDAMDDLAPFDERLGPRILRFRSGGANSNRGYPANTVGASRNAGNGGLREWEASAEVRWQLNADWGLVGFIDMSDVDDGCRVSQNSTDPSNDMQCVATGTRYSGNYANLDPTFEKAEWRFDHMHMSAGIGVRLQTPIGPFRLDVGFQVPGMQYPGRDELACPGSMSDVANSDQLTARRARIDAYNSSTDVEAKVDCLVGRPYAPMLFGLIGPELPMAWHFSFGEAF